MTILFALMGAMWGAFLALMNDTEIWFGVGLGTVVGALAGMVLSQSSRQRDLKQQLSATERQLDALRTHLDRVLQDVHQRILSLEERPGGAPTAPSAATPVATEPTLEPVRLTPVAAAVAVPNPFEPAPISVSPVTPRASAPEALAAPLPQREAPTVAPEPEEAHAQPSRPAAAVPPAHATPAPGSPWETSLPYTTTTHTPSLLEGVLQDAREWLFGGNAIVRVGAILLFLGLAFLLRYATERVVVPMELRYAGVALAALALLVVGWRTRVSHAAYGRLLQGAAIAVLYLTTFSAMRVHSLVPTTAGFVLLVVVAALAALLAIGQDARGLAVAGTLGGFAAPILASTGGGSHVALFSYFLLLNAGVLTIAWFKSWRVLNLVGFFGTFVIGLSWGLRSYEPAFFLTCEGFLLAFFLIYVLIALLFARRRLSENAAGIAGLERGVLLRASASQANAIDGTLVFGVPLTAFTIQLALVHNYELGGAWSALGLGAFYLLLARLLLGAGRRPLLLLVESYLALGIVFTSLAIPLGLNGEWTAAAWAVEGAGIYWIGMRQQRPVARYFSLLLQLGSVLSFLGTVGSPPMESEALLGGSWLGTLLLAAALLSNYWVARHARAQGDTASDLRLQPLFATLGLGFASATALLLGGSTFTALTWSLAGLAIAWGGLRLRDRAWLCCGMVLQLAAAVVHFSRTPQYAVLDGLAPFRHASFVVPLVLAMTAFVMAWCLHRQSRAGFNKPGTTLPLTVLGWATLWWAYAWGLEVSRVVVPLEAADHGLLAVVALTAMLWGLAAHRWQWPQLARFCLGLLPVATGLLCHLLLLGSYEPWRHYGALAWPLLFLAHLLSLRLLAPVPVPLWTPAAARRVHSGGVWLLLVVLAVASGRGLANLGDEDSAWCWLGWGSIPASYLFLVSRLRQTRLWPLRADLIAYRDSAGGPIVGALLLGIVVANFHSDGSAQPLPYSPLLNPLELTFSFILFASWAWQRQRVQTEPLSFARRLPWVFVAAAFLSYSCGVARSVHHWAGISFTVPRMLHSMLFQASLSLAWSMFALAMMMFGSRRPNRTAWLTGAVVIAVVVGKLFLVELSNRGGLERIISFIGVGILLLVLGYFAPIPPRAGKTDGEAEQS